MLFTNKIKAAGLYAGAAAFAMMIAAGADKAGAQDSYMPPAEPAPPAAQQQQQPAAVTDSQVQSYVQAENAIRNVQAKYQEQAAGMSSQDELAALQQNMNKDIVKAVESSGISVEEFNAVGSAIQSNPQAHERYQQLQQQ